MAWMGLRMMSFIAKSQRSNGASMSTEGQPKQRRMLLKLSLLAVINVASWMIIVPGSQELFGSELRCPSSAHSRLFNLRAAVIQYKTLHRTLPTTEQGLTVLTSPSAQARNPIPLIATSEFLDPWGRPYQYRTRETPKGASFEIWSLGGDGLDGTEDDVRHESTPR